MRARNSKILRLAICCLLLETEKGIYAVFISVPPKITAGKIMFKEMMATNIIENKGLDILFSGGLFGTQTVYTKAILGRTLLSEASLASMDARPILWDSFSNDAT